MLIKSIVLRNIRSYSDAHIDFPEGSLLLSGDIGAGKSSILLAIEFALFGIERGESADLLLRHGSKQGSVELLFSVNNEDVFIKRSLKRAKNTVGQEAGYIIKHGIKHDCTAQELKAKVLDILGYPTEFLTKKNMIYRFTVYTPQEEMKQILYEKQDIRLDTLRKVFGVDKYKLIKENSHIFVSQLREKIKHFEGMVFDYEEKKKTLSLQEEELLVSKKKLHDIIPVWYSSKTLIEEKNTLLKNTESKVKQFTELKKQLEVNSAKIKENQRQLEEQNKESRVIQESIAKLTASVNELDVKIEDEPLLESALSGKEEKLKSIQKQKVIAEQNLAFASKRITELNEEIADMEKILESFGSRQMQAKELQSAIEKKKELSRESERKNAMLDEFKSGIIDLSSKQKIAEKTIQDISTLDNCPLCLQPVDESHKEHVFGKENQKIQGWSQEIILLKEKFAKTKSESDALTRQLEKILLQEKGLAKIEAELESMSKSKAGIDRKELVLSRLGEEKEKYEAELKEILKIDISELNASVLTLKQELKKVSSKKNLQNILNEKSSQKEKNAKTIAVIQNSLKLLQQNQELIQYNLSSFEGIEEKYRELKSEIEQLLQKHHLVDLEKAGIAQESKNIERMIAAISSELKRKEELTQKLTNLKILEDWFDNYLVSLVSIIEKAVMSRLYREFNELFQNWFNVLVEDESLNARLDAEFTPILEQAGYETSVDNLSGGEKTSLALAYRLALNKVINDLVPDIKTKDIIILDEPTDGFSTEQLDKIRDVLDELKMKQVIIVSHEQKIESYVDRVIKVSKDEHNSRVSA